MSRSVKPVEWGKFGRLQPVAVFLNLPVKAVRQLRQMGFVRLRHGRTTPEDLRDDWNAYAHHLGGESSSVGSFQRTPAGLSGGLGISRQVAPISLRFDPAPGETVGRLYPRSARTKVASG